MPTLLANDADRILGETLNNITSITGLNKTSPGSKVRAISEQLSRQLGTFYTTLDINLIQAFLSGASDRYLDFFGEMLGMPRLGQETASAGSSHQNIRFYVNDGTFGTINSGISILIRSGTIVSTQSGGQGIRYRLVTDLLLSATASEAYASVEAMSPGVKGNVGTGQLKYHNFNGYTEFNLGTLKVTNLSEIVSGREVEANENYRYRLSNAVTAAEKANAMAVRLAILSVPGVADMIMIPYYKGFGSFDVIVKATSPQMPPGLLPAIQDSIIDTAAQGIYATIRGPREIGVSTTLTLKLNQQVSTDEAETIRTNVRQRLVDYINNLDIGQDLVINEIVELTMSSDARIKNMGKASKPLDGLFIYTPSRLQDNKIRMELTDDYVPKQDERLIIETSADIGDPVKVVIEGY
jgi:uncharacterized phage protein gp47/JayE